MLVQKINNIASQNSNNQNKREAKFLTSNNASNDSFSISNKNNISFKAYHGHSWYGTQAGRDALKYKIQLTPQRIDDIYETYFPNISKCSTEIYKAYLEDAKKVALAHSSMNDITNELGQEGRKCLQEAANKKTSILASSIPGVNIVAPAITFIAVANKLDDIEEDSNGIVKNYWNDGIETMTNDRQKSESIVLGILDVCRAEMEKLEERKGSLNAEQQKMYDDTNTAYNKISYTADKLDIQHDKLHANLYNTVKNIEDNSKKINDSRSNSALKTVAMRTLSMGLDFGLAEEYHDNIVDNID